MADITNKTFNTRLKLKYDSYQNWTTNNPVLLQGEAAVCVIPAATNAVQQEPAILFKVGDGTKTFNQLEFVSAKAADVYDWAKESSITVSKNGSGNVISSITWDSSLNGGKGGLKYETASVATSEGFAELEAIVNGINDDYLKGADKTELEGKITAAQNTVQGAVDTLAGKVGTVAEGKTVVGMIGESEAAAKAYADGLAKNYDAAGSADAALASAKSYADGLAKNYDAAGAAAAAEKNAKDYADGLASNYDAKGSAAQALVDAKTYADGKDAAIAAAKKAGDDAQADVNALEAKVGTVPADKTVVQMISEAQTAATYDDTQIKADIKANADAIGVLNGDASTEGSVNKKIADAVAAIMDNPDETMNSIKELVDWTTEHAADYLALSNQVTQDGKDIDALEGLVGTESVETQITNAITAALKVGNVDKYALATDLTAAIARIVELEKVDHDHENKTVLDGITAEKVAAWDGAQAAAESTAATALANARSELETEIAKKVNAEAGKGLSANDFTDDFKTKLEGIADGAQVNVIETVKVNGVALTPDGSKAVDVTVPTGALAVKDKVAEGDLETALATKINGKVDKTSCGDIISHNTSEFAAAGHNHDDVYSKLNHNHKIEDLAQEAYIIFDCGSSNTVI